MTWLRIRLARRDRHAHETVMLSRKSRKPSIFGNRCVDDPP
jgi:hypothetical protein